MPRSSHLRQPRSTAFFAGVRVSGVAGRYRENADAVRARLLRWGDWLRLLKRALLARGLTNETVTAKTAHAVRARWFRWGGWLRRFKRALLARGPTNETVTAKTRTPSEPACFGGAIGFAGSSGLFCPPPVRRSICTGSMSSLDREPKKNAPLRAFEPGQANGILRRRARFWGWRP